MTTHIVSEGNQQFALQGSLDFSNATDLFMQGKQLLAQYGQIVMNLKNVVRSDSAGLALLLAWLRFAKENNKQLHFIHAPDQMRHYAEISGLKTILNFG